MIRTISSNRVDGTAVTINGPVTLGLTVNQKLYGSVWNDLGDYSFDLGGASVAVADLSSALGKHIIADVVRFTLILVNPVAVFAPRMLFILASVIGLLRLRRK
jgi:hypothetical protein